MRKKMGAVTYLRAFGSRLTPTDGRWEIGDKKALSSTPYTLYSIKLFLVFLILIGMIGGVVGAKFETTSGKTIEAEYYAATNNNGQITIYAKTYDKSSKTWKIYKEDPSTDKLIEIGTDGDRGLIYLEKIASENKELKIKYRNSPKDEYKEIKLSEISSLLGSSSQMAITKTENAEIDRPLTSGDLEKLESIGIKAENIGIKPGQLAGGQKYYNSIEGLSGNKCDLTNNAITCLKQTEEGQWITNFIIPRTMPNPTYTLAEQKKPTFPQEETKSHIITTIQKSGNKYLECVTESCITYTSAENAIASYLIRGNKIQDLNSDDPKIKEIVVKITDIDTQIKLYSSLTPEQRKSLTDTNINSLFPGYGILSGQNSLNIIDTKKIWDITGITPKNNIILDFASQYETQNTQLKKLTENLAKEENKELKKNIQEEIETLNKEMKANKEFAIKCVSDFNCYTQVLANDPNAITNLETAYTVERNSFTNLWGLTSKSSKEQLSQAQILSITQEINKLYSKCTKSIDECNIEVKNKLEENKNEIKKGYETKITIKEDGSLIITDECKSDVNCMQRVSLLNDLTKTQTSLKRVQTTPLYDILTLLTIQDSNSIKAAKLFGFEANFSNVPAFLKESIPSQICLAKIDGYLDKQIANTVNGQGGVTSYGCSQDYTQMYNEQTKKYEKVPNTQCLEVLADLRAQRTQITPDNKTLISYSYFLRSPPNTKIKYVVAISYKEGNTIKKKQIIDLTTLNGTKNGFDSVEIALNSSSEIIDENSFTINLLAVYENKNVYQKISYPIPPISFGDTYSAPIPAKASSSSQSGASSSSGAQSQSAELSTEDMLAMI